LNIKLKFQYICFGFSEASLCGNHLQNHPHDDDYEQDQKLLFIHDFLTIVFTPGSAVWFEIENHNLPVVKRKIASYNDAYLSGEIINAIWQPPKFC
jgi:hypothetical protein